MLRFDFGNTDDTHVQRRQSKRTPSERHSFAANALRRSDSREVLVSGIAVDGELAAPSDLLSLPEPRPGLLRSPSGSLALPVPSAGASPGASPVASPAGTIGGLTARVLSPLGPERIREIKGEERKLLAQVDSGAAPHDRFWRRTTSDLARRAEMAVMPGLYAKHIDRAIAGEVLLQHAIGCIRGGHRLYTITSKRGVRVRASGGWKGVEGDGLGRGRG